MDTLLEPSPAGEIPPTSLSASPWRITLAALGVLMAVAVGHFALFRTLRAWPDPDAAFHYQVMKGIWQDGPWFDIPWLPGTVLGSAGPDHHWLYHLVLSPFTALGDPILASHAANAASFALVPASLYAALRMLRAPAPGFWTAACLGTSFTVVHRWSMLRAQTLASAYLVLFLAALVRRRWWAVLLLAFLFMESYHAALMLIVPAAAWTLIDLRETRRLDWRPLASTLGGLVLGLLASPWFPRNIAYFYFHTFVKVGNAQALDIGREWYGGDAVTLLRAVPIQAAMLLTVALLSRNLLRNLSPGTLLAAATLAFFGALSLKHVRFVEYLPQTLVMTAALVARDTGLAVQRFPAKALLALTAAGLVGFGLSNGLALRAFRARSHSHAEARLRAVGRFLTRHAAPGAMILNETWDDLPMLAVHAPGLRFATGLDPYYLAHADPGKAAMLAKLHGRLPMAPGEVLDLRGAFGTDWVVARNDRAIAYLFESDLARGVVESEYALVFYLGDDPTVLRVMTPLEPRGH